LIQQLLIVKDKILLEIGQRSRHDIIIFQIHFFMFDASSKSFNKNVVEYSSSVIPTNSNVGSFQTIDKAVAIKLHALTVDDF
jgi:hypothetical protein